MEYRIHEWEEIDFWQNALEITKTRKNLIHKVNSSDNQNVYVIYEDFFQEIKKEVKKYEDREYVKLL